MPPGNVKCLSISHINLYRLKEFLSERYTIIQNVYSLKELNPQKGPMLLKDKKKLALHLKYAHLSAKNWHYI